MNLIYFIKLILRNIILIGAVGVFMAVSVYIMTRNQPDTYSSQTILYTGLATGFDIESQSGWKYDLFGTNAKFDNLLNIIKIRKTQEETAIRLMVQHLMLERPDPGYCLRSTWNDIQEKAPREVKNLIHFQGNVLEGLGYDMPKRKVTETQQTKEPIADSTTPRYRWVKKTVMKTEMVSKQKRKVRSTPKYYLLKAGDYPIDVAQRNGLSLAQLRALNGGDSFRFQGGQSICVGKAEQEYFIPVVVPVEVAVDTLVRELVESVAEDTGEPFVEEEYSPDKEDYEIASDPTDQMNYVEDNFDAIHSEALSKVQAFERSVQNLIKYKNSNQSNYVYTTLQSSHPFYSVKKIAKVKAVRMQNSDFLKLTFTSEDPGVCRQTLKYITDVSKANFQSIKGAQTSLVSDYFRAQRDIAKARLDSLEDYIKEYRMKNSVINYNEQTKAIAQQNELLDRDWYDESAKLSASKAALYSYESEMDDYAKSLSVRTALLDLRKEISSLLRRISFEEIKPMPDSALLASLKIERVKVERQMNQYVSSVYQTSRTTEGIDMKQMLGGWLTKVIEVEESRARFDVKTQQKKDFKKKYDTFAPLGSTLTKIERQINLVEQEYLRQIHSLDLSLMKQKNNEQSSIKPMDEPYFPTKPNASKRMFIVIAAFMAGLFLTAGIIILLEFLDTSIKFPEKAEELTKSKLIGAYPKIPLKPDPKIDYPQIKSRLIDMLSQRIKLEELQDPAIDKPYVVMILSTRQHEGKTLITSEIVEKFRAVGHKVLYIKPFEESPGREFEDQYRKHSEKNDSWDFEYEIPDNFISTGNVNELIRDYTFMTRSYNYIFIELPPLLRADYPSAIVAEANLSLLVCQAARTWNNADSEVLNLYKTNTKKKIFSLLNGTQITNLEGIIGEIPRKRSVIRKILKRIVYLDFKFSKGF
ncbi:MAG: hypothetical protein U9N86_01135 [Bacteroidota bacterium]|nr:hypothetical protein [Bacteroidota bacterium]